MKKHNNIKQWISLKILMFALFFMPLSCLYTAYADETGNEDETEKTDEAGKTDETKNKDEIKNTDDTGKTGVEFHFEYDEDGSIEALTCTVDGKKYKDGWLDHAGKTYYFRGGGLAITDEFRKLTAPDGSIGFYYFNKKGQMFTGGFKKLTVKDVESLYYFGEDGKAYTGGVRACTHKNGTVSYYYFGAKGRAVTDFYVSELNDTIKERITGISYPADDTNAAIHYGDLRYVHVLHYNFKHKVKEGEIICNKSIANDLLEIFTELYENEYEIAKIRLIDEYNGDDDASCEDDNTSCFNYRLTTGGSSLSKHAYGTAIDINPYENPYVTRYNGDRPYADRSKDFDHKITTSDLCYKLFTEHGFKWGGSWINIKDYQHFEKK